MQNYNQLGSLLQYQTIPNAYVVDTNSTNSGARPLLSPVASNASFVPYGVGSTQMSDVNGSGLLGSMAESYYLNITAVQSQTLSVNGSFIGAPYFSKLASTLSLDNVDNQIASAIAR